MGNLITLTDLKTALNISGTAEDDRLNLAIAQAEAAILRACGRSSFLTASYAEKHDGCGHSALWLRHTPITAITSVVDVTDTTTSTTLLASEYTYDAATGELWMYGSRMHDTPELSSSNFSGRRRAVVVSYTGGYANQAAVPADLQAAAMRIANATYYEHKQDPSIASETHGNYSVSRAGAGANTQAMLAGIAANYGRALY